MAFGDTDTAQRIRAAAPAVAVHLLLGLALIYGLAGSTPDDSRRETETRSFDILPDAPVPPPPPLPPLAVRRPDPSAAPRPEGAAAPANLEAQPRPLEAPEPVVPLPLPQPAAPVDGTGAATSAGAAPVPGPGTGAGGAGSGAGSGAGGNGPGGGGAGGGAGDGGGGRVMTMPRQIAGDLSERDMPEELFANGFRGTVGTRFLIDTDGRAKNCQVIRRSGSAVLDARVCRLIEQRYRFVPARDEDGRPVAIPGEDFPSFEAAVDRSSRRRRDDDE